MALSQKWKRNPIATQCAGLAQGKRNCMIRRPGHGPEPAISKSHVLGPQRRCYLTATYSLPAVSWGGDFATPTSSAELYDPVIGAWTPTHTLNSPRAQHTATLLPDGEVLAAGGLGQIYTHASAELYDPASQTWTRTGNMKGTRREHTAALLPNGQVFVVGGLDVISNTLASARLYDPAGGRWTEAGNLAVARSQHTSTLLTNGKVLIAGGLDSSSNALASAELYDSAD